MPLVLGDTALARGFVIDADEPAELLGTDTAANPQELILAALNACMTATYAANAAAMNIELQSLTIRTKGSLDLRGFLESILGSIQGTTRSSMRSKWSRRRIRRR